MFILIFFGIICAMSLVGLAMATATHKSIASFHWFAEHNWSDAKVHGVGAGITVLGVVIMLAVIASVISHRRSK